VITREPRGGGDREADSYRTCSDLSGKAQLNYSAQVDASSNIGVFLNSVRKCWTEKVNELTSNLLLNWRNLRQKLSNYWLRLTVKPSDNQCNGRHHHLQDKKKYVWVIQSSRPCLLFSSISMVLWWQSGYPAARQYISIITQKSWQNCMNVWKGNDQNYGEMGGFCTRTMCQPTTHCLWSNF
jgi:hypothetical protein